MSVMVNMIFLCVVVHSINSHKVDDYITKIFKLNKVLREYKADNYNLTAQVRQMDRKMAEKINNYEYLMDVTASKMSKDTTLVKELKHNLAIKYAEEANLLDKVSTWQQNYTLLEQDLAALKGSVVLMKKRKKKGKDKSCKIELITAIGTKHLQPRSLNKKRLDELNRSNVEVYRQNLKQFLAEIEFNKALKKMLTVQLERKMNHYKTMDDDIKHTLTQSLKNITESQNVIDLLKSKIDKVTEVIDLLKLKLSSLHDAMIEIDEEIDNTLPIMKQFIRDSMCYRKLERQVIGMQAMSTELIDIVETFHSISRRHRVHD